MSDESDQRKSPKELEVESRLNFFNEMPVRAIASFLECFDSDGQQALEVPPHVLAFLQERLQSFMQGDHASIDLAFGGGVARQRKTIKRVGSDDAILWDLITTWDEIKMTPNRSRGQTPYEEAVCEIAQKHNKSEDTIRDIYKRSKKQ